jgi:hypothetical protein
MESITRKNLSSSVHKKKIEEESSTRVFTASCSPSLRPRTEERRCLGFRDDLTDVEGERPEQKRGRGLLGIHCLHGDLGRAKSKEKPRSHGSFPGGYYL